jgi:hypothetical protein
MRGACRFVLAVLLTLACSTALAARMDAVRVFKGVKTLLSPRRFREIKSVYAASDGNVWAIGLDNGYGRRGVDRDPSWFVRRFNGAGKALGPEITPFPYFGGVGWMVPVGTAPDGSLVVETENLISVVDPPPQCLARISPTGATTSSGQLSTLGTPYIDRDGIVHAVTALDGSYVQVSTAAPGLAVVRTLDYGQPFGGLDSTPGYLRWGGQLAFFSDEHQRLVVATRMMGRDGSRFRLCRVDTKALTLLDSGSLNVYQDTFRTFIGPHFPIPRLILVPAESSGYWLFMPTDATPPAATMFAYRLTHDLKVVHPHAEFVAGQRPFSEAPKDAAIIVQSGITSRDWREDGAWLANTKLKLEFIALGRDGEVYTQTLEDSVASRVTK